MEALLGAVFFAFLILVIGVSYSCVFYGTNVRYESMMFNKHGFFRMLLGDVLPLWMTGMVLACSLYEWEMYHCEERYALAFKGTLANARNVSVLMTFVLVFRASEAFGRWTRGRDHLGSLTNKSVQLVQSMRSVLRSNDNPNEASKELFLKEARLLKLYMLMQCNLLRNVSTFGEESLIGGDLQHAIRSLTPEELKLLSRGSSKVLDPLARRSTQKHLVRILPVACQGDEGMQAENSGLASSRINLCLILTWIEDTVVAFAKASAMPPPNMNYMTGLVKQVSDESENLWQVANTGIPIIMHWCVNASVFMYCAFILPAVVVIEVAVEIQQSHKCGSQRQIAIAEMVMLVCYTMVMVILCSLRTMALQMTKPFGSFTMALPMEKFCSQASEHMDIVSSFLEPEVALKDATS